MPICFGYRMMSSSLCPPIPSPPPPPLPSSTGPRYTPHNHKPLLSSPKSLTLSPLQVQPQHTAPPAIDPRLQPLQDLVQTLKPLPASPTFQTLITTIENDGGFRSVSIFNNLLAALIAADEFQLALKFISNLSSYGLAAPHSTYYSFLVACYCNKNDPFGAKHVLDRMLGKGLQPNVATFTTLINSFCNKGRMSGAFEVLDIMVRIGCQPTINTYNCLLKGLCYVGKVEEAYDLLAKIKNSSKKPDIYTYTAVMNGLCKVGRSDEASHLLDEAVKFGLTPNAVTYNTLFNGYFKEGRPLDGLVLLKRMKEGRCSPDCVSYSTLLHGLLKWREIPAALRVYEEMVDIGYVVGERLMNMLLRALWRQAPQHKRYSKYAYELFEKMRSSNCNICPRAHCMVIEALCAGKEVNKALRVLREMIRIGSIPKSITFSNVVCDEGKFDEALSLLHLMQSDNRMPMSFSFDILIGELNRHGKLAGAPTVYAAALKRGFVLRGKPRASSL